MLPLQGQASVAIVDNSAKIFNFHFMQNIDHSTVVAKLPGFRMEARLPVTLF